MQVQWKNSLFGQREKWQAVAGYLCAELPRQEGLSRTEGYLRGYLYQEGFSVRRRHPAGCPFALSAETGGEGPCLGLLALYDEGPGGRDDALSVLAAAVALKEQLAGAETAGRLVFYGCGRREAPTLQQAGVWEECDLLLTLALPGQEPGCTVRKVAPVSRGRELPALLENAAALLQAALDYMG